MLVLGLVYRQMLAEIWLDRDAVGDAHQSAALASDFRDYHKHSPSLLVVLIIELTTFVPNF